jgi:hypothetical protein
MTRWLKVKNFIKQETTRWTDKQQIIRQMKKQNVRQLLIQCRTKTVEYDFKIIQGSYA